jgi:hypothetical protein
MLSCVPWLSERYPAVAACTLHFLAGQESWPWWGEEGKVALSAKVKQALATARGHLLQGVVSGAVPASMHAALFSALLEAQEAVTHQHLLASNESDSHNNYDGDDDSSPSRPSEVDSRLLNTAAEVIEKYGGSLVLA